MIKKRKYRVFIIKLMIKNSKSFQWDKSLIQSKMTSNIPLSPWLIPRKIVLALTLQWKDLMGPVSAKVALLRMERVFVNV